MARRKRTHEEYEKLLNEMHGGNIVLVGKYKGTQERIEVSCQICKHTWNPVAADLIRARVKEKEQKCCPSCKTNNHSKNIAARENFLNELSKDANKTYKLIGKYVNSRKKVTMMCSTHGEFEQSPSSFLQGHKCQKCGIERSINSKIKSSADFAQEFYTLAKNEYSLLSEYKRSEEKILVKHLKCGYEYKVVPFSFMYGRRCPKCASNFIKTAKEYERQFKKEDAKNEYDLITPYVKATEYVRVKHKTCGYEYNVKPSDFITGYRCGRCAIQARTKTTEEFKKEVYSLVGKEYSVLGEYVSSRVKIKIFHEDCNRKYLTTPSSFLDGNRCPKCSSQVTKGEKQIEKIASNLDLKSGFQYNDKNNKKVKRMKFDFYINNNLMVEYDGQQHFYSIEWFGGNSALIDNQERDKIKNQYCIDNNIPLLRIPYWEQSNIESILSTALMHFNIIPEDDSYDYTLIKDWLVDENWDHDDYISKCPKNIKDANKQLTIA